MSNLALSNDYISKRRDIYMKGNLLFRYSMQLAYLKQLLDKQLITEREYSLLKQRLMKDYHIISDLSA